MSTIYPESVLNKSVTNQFIQSALLLGSKVKFRRMSLRTTRKVKESNEDSNVGWLF